MGIYTPDSNRVVHHTYADMTARQIVRPVHLVQYDQGLPIIAVKLYNDGLEYTIPTNATVNIRCGKVDGNFVYNPALGWDSAMHTVYFEVTKQMTVLAGEINPIVEIELDNKIVSSGAIAVQIDSNPIQEQSIRSTTECLTAKQYAEQAVDAAAKAASSASQASGYASTANSRANAAAASASGAASSASAASSSAASAKTYADNAAKSATNAKASETNAKNSETKTKEYEVAARNAIATINEAAETTRLNKEAAAKSEVNAKASEEQALGYKNAAAQSEQASEKSESNAKTYADNAAESATNAKASEVNAKKSETAASTSNAAAATSATNAKKSETAAANSASLAQAVYEEILGADVGKFGSQLANEHSVLQPLYDSSGQNICDSSGNEIQSQTIFADAGEVALLRKQINSLESVLMRILMN